VRKEEAVVWTEPRGGVVELRLLLLLLLLLLLSLLVLLSVVSPSSAPEWDGKKEEENDKEEEEEEEEGVERGGMRRDGECINATLLIPPSQMVLLRPRNGWALGPGRTPSGPCRGFVVVCLFLEVGHPSC